MKKNLNILGIALVTLVSCNKLIDVKPRDYIASEIALNSVKNIEAATNSLYSRLQNTDEYGSGLISIGEALADNVTHTGGNSQYNGAAQNAHASHFSNWEASYYAINQANLILEALENSTEPQSWKDAIAGQAYFIRALVYHNLSKVYGYDPTAILSEYDRGTVPIVTTGVTNTDQFTEKERASINEMYDFIYLNLDSAYAKLSRTNQPPVAPHRATKAAVSALYSRVALYRGDYQNVLRKGDLALAETTATFPDNNAYIASWRSAIHPESIFELAFATNENIGANYSLRAIFTTHIDITNPNATTHGVLAVSDNFLNLFEADDIRRQLIWNGLASNAARFETQKWLSRGGIKDLDNVPILRYSEIILNKAEAYFNLGFEDSARLEVNKIRTRAGLTETAATEISLSDEINLQRRIELAFEGHRFNDLKRLGMNIIKPSGTIQFSNYRILAPIPYREVNASEKLIQNRGY